MATSPPPPPPPDARQTTSLLCVRLTLVLLMACLAAVSVYTTHALTSLNTEVTNERKDITLLQQRVKNQQAIISRFNSSITNADVEIEVAGLKKSLLGTEDEMRSEMQAMKTDITDLMNRTVSELDQTVT